MTKTLILAGVLVVAAFAPAHAGGQTGSFGVGAEYELNGIGGASMNYDAGQFHAGGFLGYRDPSGGRNWLTELGGRFFYHVHSTAMADFGLGGGLGILAAPNGPLSTSGTNVGVFLEPAFQIRLFIASNVALSFVGGAVIGVLDADTYGVTLGGQGVGGGAFSFSGGLGGGGVGILGGAGIHYYFF
jgi:hypothetical protein